VPNKDLLKELEENLTTIGGCGDGGCVVHVRPGMHTNGGCRCNRDYIKMSRVLHSYRKFTEGIKRLDDLHLDKIGT
jgi:hypothetical protein